MSGHTSAESGHNTAAHISQRPIRPRIPSMPFTSCSQVACKQTRSPQPHQPALTSSQAMRMSGVTLSSTTGQMRFSSRR